MLTIETDTSHSMPLCHCGSKQNYIAEASRSFIRVWGFSRPIDSRNVSSFAREGPFPSDERPRM